MQIKKFIAISTCSIVLAWQWVSAAAEIIHMPAQLNTITLQMSAEKWATTKEALVEVNVNAVLGSADISSFRDSLQQKLNQLSDAGEWHITSFIRNQDQSALERIQVNAQARIPENALSKLRDKAKDLSKPGEQLTISDIKFTPTLAEEEAVKNQLRLEIYQRANEELTQLNKIYPDSHFAIHTINFMNFYTPPTAFITTNTMNGMAVNGDAMAKNTSAAMTVSDKITLNAAVNFASVMPNS